MEQLKTWLQKDEVRGVACSAGGELRMFHRKGVIDLYTLVTDAPMFLKGGKLADRVIGRGAALLAIKGGVSEVYAHLMSESALDVLRRANVQTSYSTLQPHIINRTGDGICPVEQLTQSVDSPDEAYKLISNFIHYKQ